MRAKSISIAVFLVLLTLSESVYGGDEGDYNTFYGAGAGASLSSTATTYNTFIGAGAGNLNLINFIAISTHSGSMNVPKTVTNLKAISIDTIADNTCISAKVRGK